MASAVFRFPPRITVLMKRVTSALLYSGSAASSRFEMTLRRGISCLPLRSLRLGSLRSVLRTTLLSSLHTDRVERAADHVIAHARQIFHAAAANEHQRVLLQVVAHAGNIGRDLNAVGQPHARHFPQRRVWLLRRLREDAHAHAAFLRAVLQRRALGLTDDLRAAMTNELTDSRHGKKLHAAADTQPTVCFEPKSRKAWRPRLLPYFCVSRVPGGEGLRGS